jgi:hypothetical protein
MGPKTILAIAAWATALALAVPRSQAAEPSLAKAQDFAIAAGLLKPPARPTSFAGTGTDEYVK